MNENAKKWVAALRSGEFKQTIGVLADEDGYCCLGVACEVARKNGVHLNVMDYESYRSYDGKNAALPAAVQDWLGLSSFRGDYADTCLTYQNDDGLTFSQISDIIESEPEGLFVKEHPTP